MKNDAPLYKLDSFRLSSSQIKSQSPMTARTQDLNGFVEIKGNPISKAGVFDYLGSEIGAPEPDRVYKVYRPAEELSSPEAIASFKLAPLVDMHTMLGQEAQGLTPAERKGVQGVIGENVYYDAPYLRGNIKIFSEAAKALVDSGERRELSPGYRCKYEFAEGVFDGERYDAIQRDIRANHLALVEEGRTGSDVAVLDHAGAKFALDSATVKEAMMADENQAAGAPDALAEIAGKLDKLLEIMTAKAAAEMADETPAESSETPAPAVDAEPEEKPAADAEPEEGKAMDAMRKELADLRKSLSIAQDSGAVMASIADRDALASKLSGFVGVFDHSAMTAQKVAEYGVQKLGIPTSAGNERVALDAWMHGREPAHLKQSFAAGGGQSVDLGKLWKGA